MGERSKRVRTDVCLQLIWASLEAQMVKTLPAVQETWVWSLSQEDPLEKGRATYSSMLAWKIPWTWSLVGYSPWDCKRARHDWVTFSFTKLIHFIMHQKLTILWSNYIPIKKFFFRERNTVASIWFHVACGKFLLQWQSWVVVIDHMGHRPTIFTLADFSQLMA